MFVCNTYNMSAFDNISIVDTANSYQKRHRQRNKVYLNNKEMVITMPNISSHESVGSSDPQIL